MNDVILEIQDMLYLDWNLRKMSPGTPGCFLKAYEEACGKRLYYKLSNYDSYRGVFGHECINELIVSRLMLKPEDRGYIFRVIENIISPTHINKIWEMIWKRWCHFEEVCS